MPFFLPVQERRFVLGPGDRHAELFILVHAQRGHREIADFLGNLVVADRAARTVYGRAYIFALYGEAYGGDAVFRPMSRPFYA